MASNQQLDDLIVSNHKILPKNVRIVTYIGIAKEPVSIHWWLGEGGGRLERERRATCIGIDETISTKLAISAKIIAASK